MSNCLSKSFIVIGSILLFSTCKEKAIVDYAIVSGTISNAETIEFRLENINRSFSHVLAVDDNGHFQDTLKIEKGTTYFVTDTKNRLKLYLEPTYDLRLHYDFNDFDNSIKITGKGSKGSNYFWKKEQKEKELFKPYQGKDNSFYKLPEDEFKKLMKNYKIAMTEILEKEEGLSEEFKAMEKLDLNYFYLLLLTDYEMAHAHFTSNPDFKVPDGFLAELQKVDYANREHYEVSGYYRSLARRHYGNEASKIAERDSLNRDSVLLEVYRNIPDETVRNGMYFNRAEFGITHTKDLESYHADFMSSSTNEEHKAKITALYKKLKKLMPGMPSPQFENYEDYTEGTTSLSDLAGKYLYIDVWATWCGPCINEIPALQEVEEKYHDKNIDFVSISIDRPIDKDKWKKMVAEKNLKGIQLFADNEWNSSFVKDFEIKGIPRFLLIDPKGNIVDANAPRPSSPALNKVLDSLLL